MQNAFDYFVMFAEMRTGSNFLESNLNAFDGLSCLGEAYNPHFIGYPKSQDILTVTRAMRDEDPWRLLEAVRRAPGMNGFRYFHDHDPRVLDAMLDDPRCAKIILTRNPLDSYVSWKIAQATGQWKLTNVSKRKEAKARFEGEEFSRHVEALQDFQVQLLNRLQKSGQTAFYVAYEDLQDVEVMNGLARWLGVPDQLEHLDKSLKRQNPSPITEKVSNVADMRKALAELDHFNLTRTPNFEPRRGPGVPGWIAAAEAPLLYIPIAGGPQGGVANWLAALDGVDVERLQTGLNQKQLRQWKRAHKGHRGFTVLRHPVARAHVVFCERILTTGPGSFLKIRQTLRRQFDLPVPEGEPGPDFDRSAHRAAFEVFLKFLRANLAGQTAIRVDGSWGTQSQAIAGFGAFAPPDHIFREEELAQQLPDLAARLGCSGHAVPQSETPVGKERLDAIYDAEIESLVADIYQRDYLMFGFGPWRSD